MSTATDLKHLEGPGFRASVQRFGRNLAGMILPNIAAFIAWGLITALFIETGWAPNEQLAALVDPMILYLLPLLIGYTGGRLVHGQRGAVVGAVATIGVVVGTDVPMFLGAMIIGPLAAYLMKLVDERTVHRVRAGFEMLVANFSAGILAGVMAVAGLLGVGPVVEWVTRAAGAGVDFLISSGLLPAVSLIVEPAKVLFLNNAINHGVLSPLGVNQVAETGSSILFMIETNPGPGLGILAAYLLFGPRQLRPSVPGAIVIHFLGGIHEIYFPYVLMKPRLILAAIAGGGAGVATALFTNAGLVATPSPGSIFAYLAVTPRGSLLPVLLAIVVASGVSFGVAALLLKFDRSSADSEGADPGVPDSGTAGSGTADSGTADAERSSDETPSTVEPRSGRSATTATRPSVRASDVSTLVIACDAGMGSSVMLASQMRQRLKKYGIAVEHVSIRDIQHDAQLVLTHADLAGQARHRAPEAVVVEFNVFLGDPAFDRIEAAFQNDGEING